MRGQLTSVPNMIQWHDGMLLTPGQFFDLSLRQEGLQQYAAAVSSPFNWGVSALSIGSTELQDGVFSVTYLEGILPDGFVVWHEQTEHNRLELVLAPLKEKFGSRPFTVYLTLPIEGDRGDRRRRYVPERDEPLAPEMLEEEHEEQPTPYLVPHLQLKAQTIAPDANFSALPIARLQFDSNGFHLVESFEAPAMKLALSSRLTERCSRLLSRVRLLATSLQNSYRALSPEKRQGYDFSKRSAVQQLVAMLPYAEGVLETGELHPYQVYLSFLVVAGHLSSIAADPIPPNFNRYNHADMASSFDEVHTFISKVIAENSSEHFQVETFVKMDDSFAILFQPHWKGKALVLGMTAPNGNGAALQNWASGALIGSQAVQDELRIERRIGARREPTRHEEGIVVPSNVLLFRLINDDSFIHGGEVLEVASGGYNQDGMPDDMTLYVSHL